MVVVINKVDRANARMTDVLNETFDLLYNTTDPDLGYPEDGYRLVQQSLWFSVDNEWGVGYVSNLVNNGALTQPGQAFASYVQQLIYTRTA